MKEALEPLRREREMAVAWAAIVLLLLGWALLWPREPARPPVCAHPREAGAESRTEAGQTRVVRCDAPGAPALRGAAHLLFGEPLDLNRASATSLEVLPGIGPFRAAAIVAERTRGLFDRVDDLRRVRGIGPRTREALEGLVKVARARAGPAR